MLSPRPKLIRSHPGRLHPVIRIERPDAAALAGIMRQHLGSDLAGFDLGPVAQLGVGASGADVTAWVRGARATARAEGRRMIPADLVAQVAPPDDRTEAEILICASHEASQVVAATLLDVGVIQSVTIPIGRTSAGCAHEKLHPRAFLTKTQLERLAVVALAGRPMDAACGAPNTWAEGGRASDLARATTLVLDIHATYGLGESLLYRGGAIEVSEAFRFDPVLRRACETDLVRLYVQAVALAHDHRKSIDAVAERLVATRVLGGDEVAAIIDA